MISHWSIEECRSWPGFRLAPYQARFSSSLTSIFIASLSGVVECRASFWNLEAWIWIPHGFWVFICTIHAFWKPGFCSCGDGTLGVPSQRGDNYECRNMKLLLKQQQRVIMMLFCCLSLLLQSQRRNFVIWGTCLWKSTSLFNLVLNWGFRNFHTIVQ